MPVFDPQKCYNPLSPLVISRFISARLFSVPQVENEIKGLHFADVAAIQEVVTDELKKAQKDEFSAFFQKLCHCSKDCIYANLAYFEFKKVEEFKYLGTTLTDQNSIQEKLRAD